MGTTAKVLGFVAFGVLVVFAVLGGTFAVEAGVMILTLRVAQLVAAGIAGAVASGQFEWGMLLRGSGGVVVMPLLLGGVLFILAGRSAHETPHFLPPHAHATS